MVPFSFAGEELLLLEDRALYWPREQALLVADLHLEKASFFARFGQMLPPYDSRETLTRLEHALAQSGARRVLCLGDNFHDVGGADRLEPGAAAQLAALTGAVDWVWITGNHDRAHGWGHNRGHDRALPGGTMVDELQLGPLLLRHEAHPGRQQAEISGHFHPRLRISARGRSQARPCAVISQDKLILPAFGALTGGMDAADPAIIAALQPAVAIDALVAARGRLVRYPLWRAG